MSILPLDNLQTISSMHRKKHLPKLFWSFIALDLIVRVLFYLKTEYVSDDAFITYRYVQNILSGQGYVYNLGEKVLGTSSPLYTLVLVCFSFIFGSGNVSLISFIISLVSDVLVLAMLWQFVPSEFNVARITTVIFVMLYPKVLLIGVSGMEASFALLLMLFSLWSYLRKRYFLTALSIGLHILSRPDAIVWNVILIGFIFFRESKVSIKYLCVSAMLPVSWVLFSQRYFGSWIPNSMLAKTVSWQHLFPAFDPLRILSGYLPAMFIANKSTTFTIILVLLLSIPFIIGAWRLSRLKSYLLLFPIFFVFYNIAFSFGRVVMADWYYLPGYIAYFIVCGFCIELFFELLKSTNFKAEMKLMIASIVIIILLILDVAGAMRWSDNISGLFLRQNKTLGRWLHEHASSNQSLLVEPIGYIGYYSGLYVHDYIGIVSPSVISFRIKYNSDEWFLEFVQTLRPNFIVLRNWEIPSNHLFHGYGEGIFHFDQDRQWFDEHYELVAWENQTSRDSIYLVLYSLRSPNVASLQ